MIQEHLPQSDAWLAEAEEFMTDEQERYLDKSINEKTGLTLDICTSNFSKDHKGTLVIIDLLHVTYDAYLHMIV